MLRHALKAAAVLTSSAIVIPYAVALIANMVCGWPMQRDRYRRALNPWKVYALNYAILLELTKVRFLGLFWRSQRFYNSASMDLLIKNIPFGSNDNFLDIYLAEGDGIERRERPVIIFLYGGTWGSGDKSMYGLLCSRLAEKLQAVVVCPNYSIFPKGFVDDMVQDVGEAIQWVKQHIHGFGGSKKKIVLMGHSAGAHLAALTLLELCIKQLVRDEDSMLLSAEEVAEARAKGDNLELSFVSHSTSNLFHFEEQHFNENDGDEGHKSLTKGDFSSVRSSPHIEGGQGDVHRGEVLESFYFVEKPESRGEGPGDDSLPGDSLEAENQLQTGELSTDDPEQEEDVIVSEKKDDRKDSENSEPERLSADETEKKDQVLEDVDDDDDLLSSIKLIIGLAGVYDIADHFEYESQRGVEDVSTMARAMYDPKHFQQFSPTVLAKALPPNIRLPPFHLLHGDADYTVPFSSSVRFGEALWDRGNRSVQVVILPDCNHYDICLDLMETKRQWHSSLLAEIRRSVSSNVI